MGLRESNEKLGQMSNTEDTFGWLVTGVETDLPWPAANSSAGNKASDCRDCASWPVAQMLSVSPLERRQGYICVRGVGGITGARVAFSRWLGVTNLA